MVEAAEISRGLIQVSHEDCFLECAGYRTRVKRAMVKDMLPNYKADTGSLQETKLSEVSRSMAKEIWGGCNR